MEVQTVNFAIIVLFLCVPQTRHAPVKAKISDSFAKAAILAARSIQDQHSKDVSKETQTKLDVADSEATRDSEQAIVSKLRFLLIRRSIHYLKFESETPWAVAFSRLLRELDEPVPSNACFNDLIENLRIRSAVIPVIPASCPSDDDKSAN